MERCCSNDLITYTQSYNHFSLSEQTTLTSIATLIYVCFSLIANIRTYIYRFNSHSPRRTNNLSKRQTCLKWHGIMINDKICHHVPFGRITVCFFNYQKARAAFLCIRSRIRSMYTSLLPLMSNYLMSFLRVVNRALSLCHYALLLYSFPYV